MTSLLRVRKRQQHAHVSSRIDASLLRTLFNTITIVPVHQECVILIREDTRSSTTCEKKKIYAVTSGFAYSSSSQRSATCCWDTPAARSAARGGRLYQPVQRLDPHLHE